MRGSLRAGAALVLLLAAVLGAAPPAGADKYAGEFLELGLGARSLAMGGSFLTLAEDASGGYWNPAALARAPRQELLLAHSEQFGGLETYDAGALVRPLGGAVGERSAVGMTFLRLAIPDIAITTALPFTDTNGNGVHDPGEPVLYTADSIRFETFAYHTLLFSYGRELDATTSWGGSVKIIRDSFDANSALGIGLDLGVLHRGSSGIAVGAVLRDATSTLIIWDTDHTETISPSLRLGASWTRSISSLAGSLTLAGEMVNTFENRGDDAATLSAGRWGADLQAGAEYWFRERLAVRAGHRAGSWAAGAGFRLGRLAVDYAFLEDSGLDSTHRVSGSVLF